MDKKIIKNLFTIFIKIYLIGTLVGGFSILVLTLDFETVPAGLLFPILLIPSLVLYIVFDFLRPKKKLKNLLFWIPAGIIVIYLLTGYVLDLLNIVHSEIGGEPFLGASVIILIISSIEYYCLKRTGQK